MKALISVLALVLLAAPAVALDDPDQLVKALYRETQIPLKSRELDRYFARDLAAAIKKDIAPRDEVGLTNGGDYRYGAQEFQITDLAFLKTTNRLGGTVTATFKNFGKEGRVVYTMCLARRGWRIANVEPGDWNMREALKLPAVPVNC